MSSKELEQKIRAILREELGKTGGGEVAGSDMITITEAAALGKYGVSTIRSWLKQGRLSRYGTGRCTRISRSEFVAFLRSNGSVAERRDADATADAVLRRLA